MDVQIVKAYPYSSDIHSLFSEYAAWIGIPLDFQDFDEEMASLPGKYAEPEGRLYIALVNNKTAGCIALRYFDSTADGLRRCEMKRLYVRNTYKGLGIGRLLAQRIIDDARMIGYSELLLDSFDFMVNAIALYKKLGFEEISPYRYNPYSNVKYLRLALHS